MKKQAIMRVWLCRILCAVMILSLIPAQTLVALADGEFNRNLSVSGISATVGGTQITGIYSDPVTFYEEAASGYLNDYKIRFSPVGENDIVLYTAWYPETNTGRSGVTEYACEPDGAAYRITAVNPDGNSYIPVGGFVLSGAKGSFQVGDQVVLGGSKLSIPNKAVESSSGKRLAIDHTNVTRSAPMVVYYDYQFGSKTGTNVFGTEMTCTYDFENNTFKVVSFRGFGTGDASGSDIPDNSFVLSAYGEGYRSLLVKGELFQLGDSVKMVGFDFIRFGGSVQGEYDFVNPTLEENPKGMETETTPFPAYRGENQTMIYKDGWNYNDAAGTGTNVYGFEAAVDANGIVVELGVNVSQIPEGGYVISGHGRGRDFIRSNIVLGATVVLDEAAKTFTVSTTLNSYYENLATSLNSTITVAENRMRQLFDLDKELLNSYISEAKTALTELKTVKEQIENGISGGTWSEEEQLSNMMNYNSYQLQVERLQQKINTTAAESKPVAARAVWHRPTEMSYAEIEETVKLYAKVGINMVFVETLYGGYSTFRTDSPEFPYNPKLAASYNKDNQTVYADYLSAFVACCLEYGIEPHAWVENFYVGLLQDAPVLKNHPDWVMYNDDGTVFQRNEGGAYVFIDAANRDVQDALIAYYKDMFKKVPGVAGLNLDYIRYPVSNRDEDTGYTIAAMEGFAAIKGMSFSDAQKADREKMARKFSQLFNAQYLAGGEKEATQNYNEWVSYRTNVITEYVRRIKTEIKDTQDIILSTSVFASVSESLNSKKQDWKTWFANGWIDIATPMAYYTDPSDVLKNVTNMILSAGDICYYYTGIASSFSGLPAWQNKEQVEASYMAGANGYVIFCSTQIVGHEDVQEVLMAGINSAAAVLPHASMEQVLKGYFDRILDRAERLYIPAEGMTQKQYTDLKAKFDEIVAMSADGPVNIKKIQAAVEGLYSATGTKYAKGYSGQRLVETLKELSDLLDTRISIALVEGGHWNPESGEKRPTVTVDGIKQPQQDKPGDTVQPTKPNTEKPPKNEPEDDMVGPMVIVLCVCAVVMLGTGGVMIYLVKAKKFAKDEEEK